MKVTEPSTTKILDNSANPAPLGLLGFGVTTVLLNLHNAGVFPMVSMILAMGIFYGGMAQIFAGLLEWRKGNTFGTTAFTSYGLFWLSLVGLLVIPKLGWADAAGSTAMAWYLLSWGVFTALMFIGTLKLNRGLQFVFASLAILFFLLAAGDGFQNTTITKFAGIEGIICGLSAVYVGIAQVLNEVYGRVVAPVWPVKAKDVRQAEPRPMSAKAA